MLLSFKNVGNLDDRLVCAYVAHLELRNVKPKLTIIRRCFESRSIKNLLRIAWKGVINLNRSQLNS